MNQISPNEVTFASRLKSKNASQLSERHFGEVPSDMLIRTCKKYIGI